MNETGDEQDRSTQRHFLPFVRVVASPRYPVPHFVCSAVVEQRLQGEDRAARPTTNLGEKPQVAFLPPPRRTTSCSAPHPYPLTLLTTYHTHTVLLLLQLSRFSFCWCSSATPGVRGVIKSPHCVFQDDSGLASFFLLARVAFRCASSPYSRSLTAIRTPPP